MEGDVDETAVVEPEALAAAPPAIRICEAAVRDHHVVRLTYESPDHGEEDLLVEPLGFRYNRAHHIVLWVRFQSNSEIGALRTDRIRDAVDTGQEFVPDWPTAS